MNPGSDAVRKLASLGYRFELAGDRLRYRYEGPGKPDPDTVRPLLATVREHKPDVVAYLGKPAPTEHILTCFECPLHEHDTVNPSEGWGKCLKRNKGRYGCATACEVVLAPGHKDASNAHLKN